MRALRDRGGRDMTEGSVAGHLLSFSAPLLLGNLLQQMYNMVDSWTVGRFVGDTALTAVGAGSTAMNLLISLFMGLGTGATVVVSQFCGARKPERIQAVVDTVYRVLLAGALPLTALALLSADWLLAALRVDPAALPEASRYLRIVCLGLSASIGYNINAGILRGLGDSGASLLFLAVSAGLNGGLDLLLVAALGWGVTGAAAATAAAQFLSWLFGVVYINRRCQGLRVRLRGGVFEGRLLRSALAIGLPAGLQMATVSLGGMAVMSKVNTFGNSYSAGYSVGLRIDNLVFLPIQALSSAATAVVGQNAGAGREDRVKRTALCAVCACAVWCAAGVALLYPIRAQLVGLFTDTPETIACGARFVQCVLPAYLLLSVLFSLNSVMRGAGESVVPMVVAVIGQIFIRVPAVYYLADRFGPEYMYYGFAVGWSVGLALGACYFASGRWKRRFFPADGTKKREIRQ